MRAGEFWTRAESDPDEDDSTAATRSRIAASISTFTRQEWNAVFAGEREGWDYLTALEHAHLNFCEPLYLAIRAHGRCVAAVPAFIGMRAVGAPFAIARTQGPFMVLGSPFAQSCKFGFAERAPGNERTALARTILAAALTESRRRGVRLLFAVTESDNPCEQACRSLGFVRVPCAPIAWLRLPQWSLGDYLSCMREDVRVQLLSACDSASRYELDWRVDVERDLEALVELCGDAGVVEPTAAYFRSLLESNGICASCLVVRHRRVIVGITLVLHDVHHLREELSVIRDGNDRELIRALMWVETVRYGLETRIACYESANSVSIRAARPPELLTRCAWIGPCDSLEATVSRSSARRAA